MKAIFCNLLILAVLRVPFLMVAVVEAFVGVCGGVGALVDLESKSVAVASEEEDDDGDEDEGTLLPPPAELGTLSTRRRRRRRRGGVIPAHGVMLLMGERKEKLDRLVKRTARQTHIISTVRPKVHLSSY